MTTITLKMAHFPADLPAVLAIFREYVQSPTQDLAYQNFEDEFAQLPGDCELKRVYVRPTARGLNIGRLLVERLITEASLIGYSRMCLDVLPEFQAAQKLYASLGFTTSAPVSYNPVPGTQFLALQL